MKISTYKFNFFINLKNIFNYCRSKILFKVYKKFHFIGLYEKSSAIDGFKRTYPEKLEESVFILNKNLSKI